MYASSFVFKRYLHVPMTFATCNRYHIKHISNALLINLLFETYIKKHVLCSMSVFI